MLVKDTFHRILVHKLENQNSGAWRPESIYADVLLLNIDNRGQIGEEFIADSLKRQGYEVFFNNETDATNKHWDLKVKNKFTFEIKTATMGRPSPTFQHENIEKDRDYTALVLLDIGPDNMYLTVAPKETLPFTSPNDRWTRTSKKMHRRRTGINYKWTLSLRDVVDREVKTLKDIADMFKPIIGNPDA